MLVLLTIASVTGLLKTLVVVGIGILNALLALLATVSVWKAYLLTSVKVGLTLLVLVPIVGILIYAVWGQRLVRTAA